MKRMVLFTLAVALVHLVCASGSRAQPADRGRRGDLEQTIRSWDKNGDGHVTRDEAPQRAWRFLRRRAERAGVEAGDRIKIDDLVGATQSERRGEGESASDSAGRPAGDGRPTVQGFAATPSPEKVRGFGEAVSQPDKPAPGGTKAPPSDRERAEDYASGLLAKYDTNKNRVLEREEWRKISGDPSKSDANGDGVITLEEMTARLEANYRRRREEEGRKARAATRESKGRVSARKVKPDDKKEERQSYRFAPAHERLPDGLPGWFRDRDRDADGQVAMHEYSRSWTDGRAAEFARHDKNGDGVVTADEVAK